jgi:glutaredoxin
MDNENVIIDVFTMTGCPACEEVKGILRGAPSTWCVRIWDVDAPLRGDEKYKFSDKADAWTNLILAKENSSENYKFPEILLNGKRLISITELKKMVFEEQAK